LETSRILTERIGESGNQAVEATPSFPVRLDGPFVGQAERVRHSTDVLRTADLVSDPRRSAPGSNFQNISAIESTGLLPIRLVISIYLLPDNLGAQGDFRGELFHSLLRQRRAI
jgi:hypothetical protein